MSETNYFIGIIPQGSYFNLHFKDNIKSYFGNLSFIYSYIISTLNNF